MLLDRGNLARQRSFRPRLLQSLSDFLSIALAGDGFPMYQPRPRMRFGCILTLGLEATMKGSVLFLERPPQASDNAA